MLQKKSQTVKMRPRPAILRKMLGISDETVPRITNERIQPKHEITLPIIENAVVKRPGTPTPSSMGNGLVMHILNNRASQHSKKDTLSVIKDDNNSRRSEKANTRKSALGPVNAKYQPSAMNISGSNPLPSIATGRGGKNKRKTHKRKTHKRKTNIEKP
jgi:hypothetical protein